VRTCPGHVNKIRCLFVAEKEKRKKKTDFFLFICLKFGSIGFFFFLECKSLSIGMARNFFLLALPFVYTAPCIDLTLFDVYPGFSSGPPVPSSHGEFGCYANDPVDRLGHPILGGPNGRRLLLPPSAS
jgi:hypothetical protein